MNDLYESLLIRKSIRIFIEKNLKKMKKKIFKKFEKMGIVKIREQTFIFDEKEKNEKKWERKNVKKDIKKGW